MITSIIIPHYAKNELTNTLITSILKYCNGHNLNILVVDDASPVPYDVVDVQVARIEKNVGFLLASNLGLMLAQGDIKILMNNDVEVSGDFIPLVEEQIEKNPMALVGNRLIQYNTGWNTFYNKIYPYVEGYFLAASREFWDELSFDTRYVPCDMEDVDLSTEAYAHGYPVVSLESPFLTHLGARSYGYSFQRESGTLVNKEKFRQKWCSMLINVEGR